MAYHSRKTIFHAPFSWFVKELSAELHKEGFIIVATSDIRQIFKDNLQLEMHRYEILSVIIPHLFNEMLVLQPFTGFVLPALLTVCETGEDTVEVAFVDPSALMTKTVNDPSFQNITDEVERRLSVVMRLLAQTSAGLVDSLVQR